MKKTHTKSKSKQKSTKSETKPSVNKIKESSDLQSKPNSKPIEKKVKGKMGDYYGESIFFDSRPAFLIYDPIIDEIRIVDKVETNSTIYLPISKEDYGYEPYSFSNDEFERLKSLEITKESLLDEIKNHVDSFLSAKDEVKFLTIGDILLTYCQEWIDTMHTPFYVGETESGKSSAAHLFRHLGYRPLYGANIPYANIYTFLGSDEEGTGTIIEDEAQKIDLDMNKLKLYKNSYARGQFESRVELRPKRHQVHFKTFCFKVFAGEALPKDKGLNERLAVCHMIQGNVEKNIKRPSDQDKEDLRELRNKLLVWKVKNSIKGLETIQTDLKQRDQELWEDYLRVMSGTKYEPIAKKVSEYFVLQRHEKIWNSPDAKIFKMLVKKLDGNKLFFETFWQHMTGSETDLPGMVDGGTYLEYESGQRITRNSLAKIFEEKFQGIKNYTVKISDHIQQKTTFYVFKPEVIESLKQKYNVNEMSNVVVS